MSTIDPISVSESTISPASAGNFLVVVLDPILIFLCGLGISGAAIAAVISEYLIAFILLWNLSGK
ncbi:transmembrane protein, putative, partial [Medicago truncatula]